MKEIWKDITGYEGYYQVSNLGRIKSLPRTWYTGLGAKRFHNGKILKPHNVGKNFLRVDFTVDGIKTHHNVNRLVAEAFLPNPDNLPKISHINFNPLDNNVKNLKWTINSEIQKRISASGRRPKSNNKKTLCLENNIIYPSTIEAARQLKITPICAVRYSANKNHRQKNAYSQNGKKYTFEYKEET